MSSALDASAMTRLMDANKKYKFKHKLTRGLHVPSQFPLLSPVLSAIQQKIHHINHLTISCMKTRNLLIKTCPGDRQINVVEEVVNWYIPNILSSHKFVFRPGQMLSFLSRLCSSVPKQIQNGIGLTLNLERQDCFLETIFLKCNCWYYVKLTQYIVSLNANLQACMASTHVCMHTCMQTVCNLLRQMV